MKKVFMGFMAFLCSVSMWAENTFSIDGFTIAAGEKKTIEVKLFNDIDICAFQFELELPEGVSITAKANGTLNVVATNRLKQYDEFEETWTQVHSLVSSLQSNGYYRVMAYAMPSTNIQGSSGAAVVKIQIEASDQISSGEFTPVITNMELTEIDGTKHKINPTTYNCSVTLNTKITTLGYASFSWPKALDFTNSGLTAFIVTSCSNTSMHLEPVTKVPANTGLILKGTAGSENTYSIETTDDDTLDDVSENMLTSNTTGTYTVETGNVYVLSNLDDGKPGFYLASQGIHVAQYKSFLVLSENPARKGLTFDEETTVTGVNETKMNMTDDGEFYDLHGHRVQHPTKGVYVTNGKKRIMK